MLIEKTNKKTLAYKFKRPTREQCSKKVVFFFTTISLNTKKLKKYHAKNINNWKIRLAL